MSMTPAERRNTEGIIQALTPHNGESPEQREAAAAAELRTWEAEAAAARWADSAEARESANRVASELNALLAGKLYLDEDGEFTTTVPSKCNREAAGVYCFECEDNAGPGHDVEPATILDWVETCLDVELYVLNGELHHVDVLVSYGGPNCWIEGKWGYVTYAWGTESAEVFVPGLRDALVDAFEGMV
jgi:hypothetical protein